jgi:hypothetical protein
MCNLLRNGCGAVLCIALLNGCATIPLSPQFGPYRELLDVDRAQLQTVVSDAVNAIGINKAKTVPTTASKCRVLRVDSGYYLVTGTSVGGGVSQINNPTFLGESPDDAVANLMQMRDLMDQEIKIAKAQRQQQIQQSLQAFQAGMAAQQYAAPVPSTLPNLEAVNFSGMRPEQVNSIVGLPSPPANQAPAAPVYQAPQRIDIYGKGGYGWATPSGSSDGSYNVYGRNGYQGSARPSGSNDGRYNLYNTRGYRGQLVPR